MQVGHLRPRASLQSGDGFLRRSRFALLQRVVLPAGLRVLRWWLGTCRCTVDSTEEAERSLSGERVILAVLHGSMLHLLAHSLTLPEEWRQRLFVLLSASLDGQLLAAGLAGFGIDHAVGAAGENGSIGGRHVIRRVRAGEVAVIAVDGPTGPAGVAKPGLGLLARAAQADVYVLRTRASRGVRLPSWDRCHLPLPFATVKVAVDRLPMVDEASAELHVLAQEKLTVSPAPRTRARRRVSANQSAVSPPARPLTGTTGARRDDDAGESTLSSADASRTTAPDGGR